MNNGTLPTPSLMEPQQSIQTAAKSYMEETGWRTVMKTGSRDRMKRQSAASSRHTPRASGDLGGTPSMAEPVQGDSVKQSSGVPVPKRCQRQACHGKGRRRLHHRKHRGAGSWSDRVACRERLKGLVQPCRRQEGWKWNRAQAGGEQIPALPPENAA